MHLFMQALKYNDLVLEEIDSFGIEHLLVVGGGVVWYGMVWLVWCGVVWCGVV